MTLVNNFYYASFSEAGLIDLISLKPSGTSPILSKGSRLDLVQDDYFGVKRSGTNVDIGAVTH